MNNPTPPPRYCGCAFPAPSLFSPRRRHVLLRASRSDVALAGGFLGRDYRSGFHSITRIPLVRKHLHRAVSLAHEPLTTLTKKRSLLAIKHHGGVTSAKEVTGDLTWSLDAMTAFHGVPFQFGTVIGCDRTRTRRRPYRPSTALLTCDICKRAKKDMKCTFDEPWSQGRSEPGKAQKPSSGKPANRKRSTSSGDTGTASPEASRPVLPESANEVQVRRSLRGRNTVETRFLKRHEEGIARHTDLLVESYIDLNANIHLINRLREAFDSNIKRTNAAKEGTGVLRSWKSFLNEMMSIRDVGPNNEQMYYGILEMNSACAMELLGIKSLSDLLPKHYKPKQVEFNADGASNPRASVVINTSKAYTQHTHSDVTNNYLVVVKGEKCVYISNQKTLAGRENGAGGDSWPDLQPREWHLDGKMTDLTEEHGFTKHTLGEGRGMLIPKGFPHSVHTVKNSVGFIVCVDDMLVSLGREDAQVSTS